MKRWFALATASGVVTLLPDAAQAHLVVTGMGPIYDGIVHFGLSPEDYLPVVALAFYAGLRGAVTARWSLAALIIAWFIGGTLAMFGLALPALVVSTTTAALFLCIGGLLASNIDMGRDQVWAVAGVALGLVRGNAGFASTAFSMAHVFTLTGMTASVFVVFALAVSMTLPLQRGWLIVAARVSGSWIAAIGLLFLGWIIRYGIAVG